MNKAKEAAGNYFMKLPPYDDDPSEHSLIEAIDAVKAAEKRGAEVMLALIVKLYKEQGIMLCGDNDAIWQEWEKLSGK